MKEMNSIPLRVPDSAAGDVAGAVSQSAASAASGVEAAEMVRDGLRAKLDAAKEALIDMNARRQALAFEAASKMCIMKRANEEPKIKACPWMNTAADKPIDDQAAKEITLDRVQRIGREYLSLRRSLMMKNEPNIDDLI